MNQVKLVNTEEVYRLIQGGILIIYDNDFAISWLGAIKRSEDLKETLKRIKDCKAIILIKSNEIFLLKPKDGQFICHSTKIDSNMLDVYVFKRPRSREPSNIIKLREWLKEASM